MLPIAVSVHQCELSILDSNLTYNEHIVSTVSSCMSRLGQINRVKHIFDKRALSIIINPVVFSKTILLVFCLEQYYSC